MLACHRSIIFGSQKYFHFAVEGVGDAAQFRKRELLLSGDLAVVGRAANSRFRVEPLGGHPLMLSSFVYLSAQWREFFACGHNATLSFSRVRHAVVDKYSHR